MHTRGCLKKRTQDLETEEGKQERETETIQDTEMEQQAGDKEDQPAPKVEVIVGDQPVQAKQSENVGMQEMIRLMMELKEESREQSENLKKQMKEEIYDNFRKQEEKIHENSRKQNETLSENLTRQINENNKQMKEELSLIHI